jgi:O-antigen ligase
MPFNYYDIVTALTVGILALSALFFITRNAKALFILAILSVPFSSEMVVELPIRGLELPTLFFPTDFLAGIITLFILFAIPFVAGHGKWRLGLRHSRVFLVWALYFLWMFITTLLSGNPIVSAKFLLLQIAYALTYGGLGYYFLQGNPGEMKSVYGRYMLVSLVATLFVCVVEHVLLGAGREVTDRAIAPFFREHTVYGGFTAWMFLAYFLLWRASQLSLGLLVALGFSAVALFLSYSRGGWLSAMGALVMVLVAQWLWRLPRSRALAALAGSGLLAAGGLSFLLSSQGQIWLGDNLSRILGDTGKRIASSFDTQRDLSNVGRIHRWIVAWELFKQDPLTGIGPNTYAEEYHAYKRASQLFGAIKKLDVAYAGIHSEYLTALTEMGIVGLLLLVVLYGMTLYYPLAYAFSARDKQARLIGLLVGVPLLSYYLHAFINNFMDHGKMAALIYLHWGAAMALEVQMRKQKQSIQKYGMASQDVV